jgi:hypothetical protein
MQHALHRLKDAVDGGWQVVIDADLGQGQQTVELQGTGGGEEGVGGSVCDDGVETHRCLVNRLTTFE